MSQCKGNVRHKCLKAHLQDIVGYISSKQPPAAGGRRGGVDLQLTLHCEMHVVMHMCRGIYVLNVHPRA